VSASQHIGPCYGNLRLSEGKVQALLQGAGVLQRLLQDQAVSLLGSSNDIDTTLLLPR
jgi:hypothetical protein